MTDKSRYWWFIAYPDSLPINWIDILKDTLIPVAISPLHDLDVTESGELKKSHYHILVCFDGPTTYNNINKNFCVPLNATIPKLVLSPKNAYHYLFHDKQTEKVLYSQDDIICLNGFNYSTVDSVGYYDETTNDCIKYALFDFNGTFKDFISLLVANQNTEYLKVVRSNVFLFKELLKK